MFFQAKNFSLHKGIPKIILNNLDPQTKYDTFAPKYTIYAEKYTNGQ